ncbi:orotidine-5'-phosphate decarboxylase [Lentibacillus salicampi]|uniref:Orotidine 5'-phosphate decarboxylase n=1 Tax=Lentibacillus salicampi TaxID=175306 RepID=A0A4Y9AHM7_9BACI|nr:orotidine-5'-phosphate decarboxylase [Lentibacillus salicampi]TFJ94587.1 orotidine-5'-phosphate decarboxylase [Lentibacillus salicampi]
MKGNAYLALDFPAWPEAKDFLERNGLQGVPVKVGMELFYNEGPRFIEWLKKHDHDIFLDLKLHDIPTTVKRSMKNLAGLGIDMVTIHALGGSEMIRQAKDGLMAGSLTGYKPKLLAVTILTSFDNKTVNDELGLQGELQDNAVRFSELACQNGADGVVCSVHEAKKIKVVCGSPFLTVTPGIRLPDSAGDDQKRVATPALARANGADILVVGRTVTNADHPKAVYEQVQKEWEHGSKP